MKFGLLVLLPFLLLLGCQRHYLSVSQQWVDAEYLASSQIGSPDPRKEHPPLGQLLIIQWYLPRHLLAQHPQVELDLIFWDYTTKKVTFPIKSPADWATYRCFNEEYQQKQGILTYKAAIVTEEGKIFRQWKHQLFVNLIEVDQQ